MRRHLPTLLAAILLAGCGANNTFSPDFGGGAPDFSMSVAPPSNSPTQGQDAVYTVTATPSNGFNSPVDLSASGLPPGATATFNPPTITFGQAIHVVGKATRAPGTSTLTIKTSAGSGNLNGDIRSKSRITRDGGTGTPPGTYTITITGAAGGISHSTTTQLVVVQAAAAPSFTIDTSGDNSATVSAGQLASYDFDVKSVNGFAGTITFSATNMPAGTTATFSRPSVDLTANASTGGTVNLQTSGSTPAGTYTVTIVGTSGTITSQGTVTLKVNAD